MHRGSLSVLPDFCPILGTNNTKNHSGPSGKLNNTYPTPTAIQQEKHECSCQYRCSRSKKTIDELPH